MPCASKLTKDQIDRIADDAQDELERRAELIEEHYREMYDAANKAFPLIEYFRQTPVKAPKPR